jgi:tetratricopeptide (TPR) repeat protein
MTLEIVNEKITEIIKSKRTAIFCGAGISFNSGLPIVSNLLESLFSKIQLTLNQSRSIHDSTLPFESIMEMVLGESGLEEIQVIFNTGTPNTNHKLIAKLAKKEYLKIIYTTNFDNLIEKALEEEGLNLDEDFKVFSSEPEFEAIQWETNLIKVIKIHGSASQKEEMAITMSLIASDKYSEMRRNLLYEIFCAKQCNSVVVLGYSCSDLDLTPLIESFKETKSEICFIEHGSSLGAIKAEAVSLKKEKNPFKNYNGLRIYANTDQVIKNIWCSLVDDAYTAARIPDADWKANVDQWYANSVKESGIGVKHHIASRLLYAIGEFEEAVKHNRKGIAIALKNNNMLAYSSEVANMGMALNAMGDYDQAKFCFAESIPLCKRIGNTEGLSAQLQAYGNVLHHTGDDINALDNHQQALKYAELDKDEFAISNILGNMSNSYNRLGQYENAINSLEQALLLSRKIGNKQAESSQLGIIAGTYMYMENYAQALNYCITGIEIKKTIGDKHGECLLQANLIGLYRLLGRSQEAFKIAEDCLRLAKSLGNKQVESIVAMNIALL